MSEMSTAKLPCTGVCFSVESNISARLERAEFLSEAVIKSHQFLFDE
jgi:hypothetical protein